MFLPQVEEEEKESISTPEKVGTISKSSKKGKKGKKGKGNKKGKKAKKGKKGKKSKAKKGKKDKKGKNGKKDKEKDQDSPKKPQKPALKVPSSQTLHYFMSPQLQAIQGSCIVFTIIYLLITFYLYLYLLSKKDSNYNFNEIGEVVMYVNLNLKASPISNVSAIGVNGTCEKSYKKINLGVWPGSVKGCQCNGLKRLCSKACRSHIMQQARTELFV